MVDCVGQRLSDLEPGLYEEKELRARRDATRWTRKWPLNLSQTAAPVATSVMGHGRAWRLTQSCGGGTWS